MEPPCDNFEDLQRLLALKRHELPPPGFFDRLPESIRAELREGRTRPVGMAAVWLFLRSRWRLEPALAGAMLAVVAGIYGLALLGPQGEAPVPATAATPFPSVATRQPVLAAIPAGGWLADSPTDGTNAPGSLEPRTFTAPPPGLFAPGAGLRTVPVGFRSSPSGAILPPGLMVASNTTFQFVLPENFQP